MKKLFLIASTLLCVSVYGSAQVNRSANEECKYQFGENYHAEPAEKSESHGSVRNNYKAEAEHNGARNSYSGNVGGSVNLGAFSVKANGGMSRVGEQNNSRNENTSETENYYKCVKDK